MSTNRPRELRLAALEARALTPTHLLAALRALQAGKDVDAEFPPAVAAAARELAADLAAMDAACGLGPT